MRFSKRIPQSARDQLARAAGVHLDGALLWARETATFATEVREFTGGRLMLTQLERTPSEEQAVMALARSMSPLLGFEPCLLLFLTLGRQVVHPELIYRLARPSYRFQLYAYSLGDTLTFEPPPAVLLAGA